MKTMKRIVSMLLAMLMLLGSFSVLSSAALNDGQESTIAFDTKFYREVTAEDGTTSWVETTKAARGDKVKARVFITSDFYVATTNYFWLYNTNVLTVDNSKYTPTVGKYYSLLVNKAAGSITGDDGHTGNMYHYDEPVDIASYLVDCGYLSEEIFDNHGFVFTGLTGGKVAMYDGAEWMYEFNFTVKNDAKGTAQFYLPESCLITSDDMTWDAATCICMGLAEENGVSILDAYNLESYDWDPIIVNNDMDEDSTLSVTSKITFNANGGTLAGNATSEGYIKAAATAPAVTAPAGSEFLGWVPADKELTEENVVTTFAYGYEDTAYTALYSEAAATTANYTVNVYEMGTNGAYPDAPTSTDASNVGNIDEEVSYEPTINEGFYLDTAKSTLKTTVAADGSAVINAYIARNALNVKYLDENGSEIKTLAGTYYYGATYTLANAISKVGYDWAGWEAGKTVEAKPVTDGEEITYKAAYTAADNKVVINISYVDAKSGGTVELDPYTVNTKTGNTIKIVNELPAEQEANVTYVLKSDLPTAEHYEIDPDAEYEIAVKAEGTAELEIEYFAKEYTVKFLDIDGEVVSEEKYPYFETAIVPEAPDLTSVGKTFDVWVAVDGEGDDLTADDVMFDVAGDVTYQATYEDDTFGAFFYSEEVDGWDAPELADLGLEDKDGLVYNDTFVLPDLTDAVPGYEFLGYEVLGAEYDEATRTVTMGAEDADINVIWDRIEYTVEYYLTEDVSGEPYKTVEYYYGEDVVELVPEQADILGQKFIDWTYAPALEDGKMPAESVIATMNAQPYVVAFYNANGTIAGETSGATITADAAAAFEAAATPANTTFVEWRDAEDKKFAFPVDVMSDIDVYAYCTAEVTFMVEDTVYDTVTVGYGETVTAPEIAKDYLAGYTFTGWSEIPAAITENTTITANFTANTYTATFDAADGAFADGAKTKTVENIAYNSEFTFAEVPALEGYTFSGWAVDGAKVDTLVMDAEGKTYTALYTKNGDVNYTVNIYLMDETGAYGEPKPVLESAAFGTTVTKAHADYAQESYFSADESQPNVYTDVVAADGSTTLELFYKRATVKIAVNGEEPKDYFVGQEIPAPVVDPTVIPEGFEQDPENPWVDENNNPVKVPYEVKEEGNPTEIKPNFIPADNTYKVEIYLMDTEGNYGAPVVKTETAKTNAVVSKTHADYPQDAWFLAAAEGNDATDKKVEADGSTILKLFYKRAQYEVTVDSVKAADVYHGAPFSAPATSNKVPAGYHITGWTDGTNDYNTGATIIVTGPLNLTVKYEADINTAYTVEIYTMDTNGAYGAPATETKYDETGKVITFVPDAAAEGFYIDTEKCELETTVSADDEDVIKVYYGREKYEVTVDGVKVAETYHEATIKAPATSDKVPEGYHITGWTDGTSDYVIGEEITVNAPLNLTVKYEADTNTAYTIETYTMDTEGEYGDPATETKYDETGKVITFAPNAADEGFYIDADKCVLETTVSAGDEDVIKVYYGREKYEVRVDGVKVADAYYEATFTAPETSTTTEAGYELASWNNGTYAKGEVITVTGPLALVADNAAIKYDVVFKINDSVYASAELEFGAPITSAGTPAETAIPEGYSFKGWSTDGKTVIDDFGTVAVGGNTFFAVLEINKYELSFVVDGEVVEGYPVEVEYNSAIVAPKAPDKSEQGLNFDSWVNTEDGSKLPAKMPAKDVTYKANYIESGATAKYTVEVYHMDTTGKKYELTAATTLTAGVGQSVTVDAGKDVTGFTFSETDSVISGIVASDNSTTLKVCYTRNLYTATFISDGKEVAKHDVFFGQGIPKVELAAQDGKVFKGWNPEVPASMPAENLTFTAEWEDAEYTVTFYANGKTTEEKYAYGEEIVIPANPSAEGMEFIGWTGLPADGKMPAKDIIVIANFKAAVYNVTFKNADGSVFKKNAVKFGDDIIVPAEEPTLEYHNFIGWSGIPADGKMPANDVEVTPLFEAIPVMLIPKNDTCTTVIDRNGETTADYVEGESEWFIYGLQEVLDDEYLLAEYIDVQGDGRIEIVYNELENGNTHAPWTGTGTVINVYDNNDESGKPIESFTIVIFGDLNGDSFITATDWAMAEDEAATITEWSDDMSDDYLPCRVMAADFDKNGVVQSADASNLSNVTLGLSEIDQVNGEIINL